MRLLLTFIFLILLIQGISQTSNCKAFSEAYLSILNSKSLEGYDSLIATPEIIIERDNLPNTDHFRKVVVHMQQTTKQSTKTFADKLRTDLKIKGYKLEKAEVISCYKSVGSSFDVFVIFRINDYQDTFKVGVFDTVKYYVSGAPSLNMQIVSPFAARLIINGQTYLKAAANSDHQKKATDIINKHFNDQEGNLELTYKQGLIATNADLWVLFDVYNKKNDTTRQVIVNLSTNECVELD